MTFRHDEEPRRAQQNAATTNEKSSRMKQILASLGNLLLFVGVFLPTVSIPIVRSLSYFNNGKGDRTTVLILAVISIILAVDYWARFSGFSEHHTEWKHE